MISNPANASVNEYLEADHRRLDRLMEACRSLAVSGDMQGAGARYAEFRTGLRRHIRIEEDLLFPAFDQASGLGDGGPTTVMRYEHVEIQRLLELIRELFESPGTSVAEFETLRSQLTAILDQHGQKEERILYPMTDQMVPLEERIRMVARMQEM
jgi:iron-sulfur cluster repair protein YtfE (RIC family)